MRSEERLNEGSPIAQELFWGREVMNHQSMVGTASGMPIKECHVGRGDILEVNVSMFMD
ncbi:hypothetical protein Rhal01_03051 [Rubritalea halochordaticola]|uniref:Uncharacterized protein n=1 Tax=Rubritalea halochordaticola TaxID=714537 RepID=A0ABP9V2E8_9BACT